METVEGLLGSVRVGEPDLRVERPGPGPTSLDVGRRWAMVAVARGRIGLLDATLGPGDSVLTRGRGAVAAQTVEDGTTLLVARFALHGTGHHLVRLPDDVVVPADSELCRLLIERVTDQFTDQHGSAPAGDVVSTRLLDWLVTETVRDVLTQADPTGTVSDRGVSAALAVIHERPAEPWTVERLARHTGVSRAAFARRFRDAVGTAPLSYLREYRLDLAERALLTEPEVTVAAVARRVGYANPFSFSAAFHRHRGLAPSDLRTRGTAEPA